MSDAVGVAFAGAAGLLGFVWQLGIVTPEDVADQARSETHVVAAVVAIALLTPVAAALAGVYRYGRYRLTLDGDRLHLAHGLVETRRITVPRRRVQVVTVARTSSAAVWGSSPLPSRARRPPATAPRRRCCACRSCRAPSSTTSWCA